VPVTGVRLNCASPVISTGRPIWALVGVDDGVAQRSSGVGALRVNEMRRSTGAAFIRTSPRKLVGRPVHPVSRSPAGSTVPPGGQPVGGPTRL